MTPGDIFKYCLAINVEMCGIHVESMWNIVEYYGIHVEYMESMWHNVESMWHNVESME